MNTIGEHTYKLAFTPSTSAPHVTQRKSCEEIRNKAKKYSEHDVRVERSNARKKMKKMEVPTLQQTTERRDLIAIYNLINDLQDRKIYH